MVDIKDGVAVLTMNRPERLNALSQEMIDTAIETLERCATDPAVGCIVLTGTGRGFCAGGDVKAMGGAALHELSLEQQVDRQRRIHRMSALLHDSPKISIAAVNGPCAGAGFGLALACDLRLAADTATFTTAFAKVGFAGDSASPGRWCARWARPGRRSCCSCRKGCRRQQAAALGLLNRVLPPAELMPAAHAAGGAHRRRPASGLSLHEGERARRRDRELSSSCSTAKASRSGAPAARPTTAKASPPSSRNARRSSAAAETAESE